MKKIISIIIIFIILLLEITVNASSEQQQKEMNTAQINYDMVIITPALFEQTLTSFIDNKANHNISTFVKTTQDIYSEYQGIDTAEEIKLFIKDTIEQYHINYVLLFGDIVHIPMRTTAVSWNYFGDQIVPDVITDLYYADIYTADGNFSDWDSNKDGIYSEIHMIMNNEDTYNETVQIIDEVDGIPDIKLGRLPCTTISDAEKIIDKIITYETTSYNSDWFHRLILMGGDTFPNLGGINEGEFVTDYIASIMPSFTPIRLWTSLNTFHPRLINKEISKGAGFVSYSGHGLEYALATSNQDSDSTIRYYMPYIIGLHNKDKYPIMYFDACLTGALDYTVLGIDIPCLTELLLKKQDSGAVACIGSTRVGFGGFAGDPFLAGASSLHKFFFESYQEGAFLGDIFLEAQQSFIEKVNNHVLYDPLTLQAFTLFGDPSLKVGGYPSE